jgi:serine/threonine protein kinase
MNTDFERVRRIFMTIVEKPSSEWDARLDEACGDDAELRRPVAKLLEAHAAGEGILDQAVGTAACAAGVAGVNPPTSTDQPGAVIGPYKLLQQIGKGGMGTVFMAEQTQPVQRKVALKIIKPGMDSRQVLARFEAERQAPALMDHPNIARVLDAGETEAGRPYFVMELVKGQPISKYCDEHRLAPRQRLELFVPVCQAVQHAHQKGIIHRDLKPSNVLIALYDGKPVPKVIDFGIAKATGTKLTSHCSARIRWGAGAAGPPGIFATSALRYSGRCGTGKAISILLASAALTLSADCPKRNGGPGSSSGRTWRRWSSARRRRRSDRSK